jgi:hypothetical protein
MSTVESTVSYRPVTGFPGYRVGDDGSVWSCWRLKGQGTGHGTRAVMSHMHWRLLKQTLWGRYLTARIGGQTSTVHTLVLQAFVGPCPPGLEGCHADDDRTNNALSNLRWGTPKSNAADRVRNGRAPRGEWHGMSKLAEHQVDAIRARYTTAKVGRKKLPNGAVAAIAQEFGINVCTVHRIAKGQSRT